MNSDINEKLTNLLNRLDKKHLLSEDDFSFLIANLQKDDFINERNLLFELSRKTKEKYYAKDVYFRALLEFTTYCKNGCFYCGINRANKKASRYRLSKDEILDSVKLAYKLGYRTFVLQGGEDRYYTDDKMCEIISSIRTRYEDSAITISFGEKSKESFKRYYDAGANRYLLRHECASDELYKKIHPNDMSLSNRKTCLYNLKEIGFQVGAGFMVGIPEQKPYHLAQDLIFISELNPAMVGIGPFIPHEDTIYKDKIAGSLELTLIMVALTRLVTQDALLPATTALGTIEDNGREKGLEIGANVVMPIVSPESIRSKYALYDGKICIDDKPEDCRFCLESKVRLLGMNANMTRGDNIRWQV